MLWWGIVLLVAGVWMIVEPKLLDTAWENQERPTSRRSTNVLAVLEPIWSRPAGFIVAPVGGAMLYFGVLRVVRVRRIARENREWLMNAVKEAERAS